MIRLTLTILAFIPSIALADFYKPDQVPSNIRPQGYDRGRAAALQIVSGSQGICSATIVSNQGHVLTALHCLRDFISMSTSGTFKGFRYRSLDRQKIMAGKVSVNLDFKQAGGSLGTLQARVVAAGAGVAEHYKAVDFEKELNKKPALIRQFAAVMQSGVGIPGDFVLLYVPKLAGRACAKTGRSAKMAEALWNIGYPIKSARLNGLGAPGEAAVFSYGQITWKATQPTNYNITDTTQAKALITRRDGVLISNIDSNTGSSGSGLFAYTGELIGVLNAAAPVADMSSVNGAKGSRFGSETNYIKQYVSTNFGAGVASQAFNCQ